MNIFSFIFNVAIVELKLKIFQLPNIYIYMTMINIDEHQQKKITKKKILTTGGHVTYLTN